MSDKDVLERRMKSQAGLSQDRKYRSLPAIFQEVVSVGSPNEGSFLKDVSQHRMTIVREDGVNRHIIFSKPGTFNQRFELITWPWHLCYTGDMGTFVFSRLEDMFQFFRDDRPGDELRINLGYWAEKIQASDKHGGHEEWSQESFRSVIEHYLENDGEPLPDGVREAVEEEIYSRLDDGEHDAYRAASEFNHNGFRFDDLWDHDFKEYTYRFVWCCYALAWGIRQYDAAKTPTMETVEIG